MYFRPISPQLLRRNFGGFAGHVAAGAGGRRRLEHANEHVNSLPAWKVLYSPPAAQPTNTSSQSLSSRQLPLCSPSRDRVSCSVWPANAGEATKSQRQKAASHPHQARVRRARCGSSCGFAIQIAPQRACCSRQKNSNATGRQHACDIVLHYTEV